jgi:hypothetical protein
VIFENQTQGPAFVNMFDKYKFNLNYNKIKNIPTALEFYSGYSSLLARSLYPVGINSSAIGQSRQSVLS